MSRDLVKFGTCSFVAVTAGVTVAWFIYLLLFSSETWIHPELLGSSAYVWLYPGQETLGGMLRKIFDWKGFDPNVNRVRPLNDVFEVIDAIARPYITHVTGPQAAFNISTVATMILAPSLLFAWLKRAVGLWQPALILLLIFIASTGFLSLTIAYIHPAKKLNLVLLCAALLFAQRDHDRAPGSNFKWLHLSLLCSFFADELALANYPIIGMIYWRTLFTSRVRIAAFATLPILFLVMTKWMLPAIYLQFGVHGAWDALADKNKFLVFGYLMSVEFYRAALIQLSRSVMSTIGISAHTPVTEVATLVIIFASPFVRLWATASVTGSIFRCPIGLSTISLVAVSTYATLLDWYPFPHEVSYLGSFNYYYHSSITVSVIVWLSFVLRRLIIDVDIPQKRTVILIACGLGAVVIPLNFLMFVRVNDLVKIIHYYPYPRDALFKAISEVKRPAGGQHVAVTIAADPVGERVRFNASLQALFGNRANDNGYFTTFDMVQRRPIMTKDHLAHFFHAYYPFAKITVNVQTVILSCLRAPCNSDGDTRPK